MTNPNRLAVLAALLSAAPLVQGATATWGVVARSRGYTCEIAMANGPATVRIASVDLAQITRVLVEVKDCDKYGWMSLYDGPAKETIQTGFGCTPMLLHIWWQGTLPDGHGTISWSGPGGATPPTGGGGSVGGGARPPAPIPGLLLHYDFMRPVSGVVVSDLSGNGRDGVAHGHEWVEGRGLYFHRGASWVETPGGGLHGATSLTVAGEITPWSFGPKPFMNVFWKGNRPDCTVGCENREYALFLHSSGSLHSGATPVDRVGVGQLALETPKKAVTTTTAYALVLDGNAGTSRLYVDGKPMAVGPWSRSGIRQTDGPLLLGGSPAPGQDTYLHGYLRSFRIYDRALSETEVSSLASSGRSPRLGRLRASDLYRPDDVVVRGHYAGVVQIGDDAWIDPKKKDRFEPGLAIDDGFLAAPGYDGPTEIVYRHDGSPVTFSGYAAVLDCLSESSCGDRGSVDFLVKGDGRTLWQSGVVRQLAPGRPFTVSLAGVRELRLLTNDGGDGNAQDWAAWLNLRLGP